ncbi:MAG: type II toxin-antitoxin system VapC family toxin [Chloroflexi bacterium]|nr:type II toxin-antitoxin system VapC family toxin [Chloroflexota bacterium]
MDLTVDASVIMAVILNEPSKLRLLKATKGAELLSAASLPWEIGNALSALFRRRRIDLAQGELALVSYRQIPVRLPAVDLEPCIRLAERYSIYAYDAYVIECARRYQSPLISLDRRQCEVARSEGIETVEVEP